jgi:hypothetical protein
VPLPVTEASPPEVATTVAVLVALSAAFAGIATLTQTWVDEPDGTLAVVFDASGVVHVASRKLVVHVPPVDDIV